MEKFNSINTLNRKKRLKTDSYFNKLVPKLLEQSNKLTKELQDRMKLNAFFKEFETKASNQFNFFLKESRTRYRGTRSGCNLDSLIANSRKKCLKVANNIINDKFYSNNDILAEKEKMKYKTTNKIYKSFRETVSKLKGLTKCVSLYNFENRKTKPNKKKKFYQNNKHLTIMSSEKLNKDKNDIKSLLTNEKLSLYKTMDDYRNELNILNSINESQKYSFAHKNMLLNLPKLNLLTYKKLIPPQLDPDEENSLSRVNFKKLLPYSRLGKNLGYTPKNSKEKNYKRIAFMTEPKFSLSKDLNTNITSIKNTNEIVLSSANKEFNIEKRINSKRKKLEEMLCVDSIPRLDSYEVLVKKMFNKKKLERKIKKNKNNKLFDVKKEEESFFEKANHQFDEGFNILNDVEKKYLSYTQNYLKQNK
jgi:hypothetical protein